MKALLLFAVLLPACMPSADTYTYACTGDAQCGEGWVCVKGLCANAVDYPPCDDGRARCAGLCCGGDEQCVTSVTEEDLCCVPAVATRCDNGTDLYLFDSCNNRGDLVTACGPLGCNAQTHACNVDSCVPSCLGADGVTQKECGADGCEGSCGDCGGVPANGVCADDKCDCNANAKCTAPEGAIVCCAAGESCVEGACARL